jgi:hypothetical protein
MSRFRARPRRLQRRLINPWNQFHPCALQATEPSARCFSAEPRAMWTTLFTIRF